LDSYSPGVYRAARFSQLPESFFGQIVLFDREFYSLSWFGVGLRAILIFTAYITLVLVTALSLIDIGLVD